MLSSSMVYLRNMGLVITGFIVLGFSAVSANSNPVETGADIFASNCQNCHQQPESKAPTLEALQGMRADFLRSALTQGKMAAQGLNLTGNELVDLISWLIKDQPVLEDWSKASMCVDQKVRLSTGPVLGDWGYGDNNHRRQSALAGGINSANVAKLKLKWALAFPQVTQMRSQPALIGDTLFIAIADASKVYALDADSGCVKWEFSARANVRSAVAFGTVDDRPILWFGDNGANIYVLDPLTGKQLWQKNVSLAPQSMITGQPVLHDGLLYVPMSLFEIISASLPSYECCTGHGGLIAVKALTGETVWQMGTTEAPQKTYLSSIGVQQWGPSGAPVWNSPAIDAKRGVLYFGTGENTSDPATATSDAIFALDLKTGKRKWIFQATKNDTFNAACGRRKGPNCPKVAGPDFDFGASVMIVTNEEGKDILIAGQKSGTVWALDPDDKGKEIWRTSLSKGSALGGVHWGLAYDGKRIIVPIRDQPALHALDPDNGDIVWTKEITPSCQFDAEKAKADRAAGRPLDCHWSYGLSAPPTVAGDVVFIGNLEGMYRAYNSATGELLWERNTNIAYQGVNGVSGHGGAIDSNGSIISNGRVYIQSGYSMFRQLPGNVLLQFTLDGK